jgi:non-specific serine/threonine protein kinase
MGGPAPGSPAAVMQRARRALGEQRYAAACAAGRAASLEQAIDAALRLRLPLPTAGAGRPRPGAIEPLTARECEVAALLAQGLSNRAIAERLVIAEATAEVHVRHILSKLGAASRAQAAVWAAQRAHSALG